MIHSKLFLFSGSLFAALGVMLGAFGAHALRNKIGDSLLSAFQTGVQYQMIHALALLLIGIMAQRMDSTLLTLAGWLILGGILLFSGSLYLLALTSLRWPGPITPMGGFAFIAGWCCLMLSVWRSSF